MSVAILIPGFVRPAEALLDSLKEKVIQPNIKRGVKVDIYTCVWDLDGTASLSDTIPDPRLGEVLLFKSSYKTLNSSLLDYDSYVQTLVDTGATNVFHKKMDYMKESQRMLEGVGQKRWTDYNTPSRHMFLRSVLFGVKSTFDMIPNPETYNFIVRSRTGLKYGHEIIFHRDSVSLGKYSLRTTDKHSCENTHIKLVKETVGAEYSDPEGCVFIPGRLHDPGNFVDDHFAIGVPSSMRIYANLYNHAEKIFDMMWDAKPFSFHNESALLVHLIICNVKIIIFPKLPFIQRLPLLEREITYIKMCEPEVS